MNGPPRAAYLLVRLLVIVLVTAEIFLILIVLVLKLVLIKVIKALLELQGLASEPVNGTGNQLLLDVLAQLVVKLELGLNVLINLIVLVRWWGSRVEEVKERRSRDGLLDDAGLLGVCGMG